MAHKVPFYIWIDSLPLNVVLGSKDFSYFKYNNFKKPPAVIIQCTVASLG